jgi:hypothetical protein
MKTHTSWKPTIVLSVVLCVMWTQIEPNAFARAQNGSAPNAVTQKDAPQPAPHKSGKKKWFVIIAVAVGAAVVAGILIQKNNNPESPTITVGPPTVG